MLKYIVRYEIPKSVALTQIQMIDKYAIYTDFEILNI